MAVKVSVPAVQHVHTALEQQLSVFVLTSASLDCLWLTSCLPIGASCCSVLRLLVSARVSLANLVHPAGITVIS